MLPIHYDFPGFLAGGDVGGGGSGAGAGSRAARPSSPKRRPRGWEPFDLSYFRAKYEAEQLRAEALEPAEVAQDVADLEQYVDQVQAELAELPRLEVDVDVAARAVALRMDARILEDLIQEAKRRARRIANNQAVADAAVIYFYPRSERG